MTATFVHEKAQEKLDALTVESGDMEIAEALAGWLVCGKQSPVQLSINHNAKAAPCPVRIDRAGAKKCTVTIKDIEHARMWALDALTRGYEISCQTMAGHETRSIHAERSRIRHALKMAEYRAKRGDDLDDEIPF